MLIKVLCPTTTDQTQQGLVILSSISIAGMWWRTNWTIGYIFFAGLYVAHFNFDQWQCKLNLIRKRATRGFMASLSLSLAIQWCSVLSFFSFHLFSGDDDDGP